MASSVDKTVGTTAVLLTPSSITGGSSAPTGVAVHALAANTATVYLGGADVLTTTGFPLLAGTQLALDALAGASLYGIAASDQHVRVLSL